MIEIENITELSSREQLELRDAVTDALLSVTDLEPRKFLGVHSQPNCRVGIASDGWRSYDSRTVFFKYQCKAHGVTSNRLLD